MRTALCAVTIIAATTISALADDLTITSRVTAADGKTSTAVSYFSKDHVRIGGGDGEDSLFDMATGQMTTIDTKKKTYYVQTREDIDRMAATLQATMKKVKEYAPADRFNFKVQNTGTTRKIAGFTCELWTISAGTSSNTENCVTNDLPFPPHSWDMYSKSSEQMSSVLGSMAASGAKMKAEMLKMKGYPLLTRSTMVIMGQKTVVGIEVTAIRQGSIPSSVWAIPAGYTKVANPMD